MSGASGSAASTAHKSIHYVRNLYWRTQRKERAAHKLYKRNIERSQGAKTADGEPLPIPQTWNIVRGDTVQVVRTSAKRGPRDYRGERIGEDHLQELVGMRGRVLRVLRKQDRIIVEGVNMRTRVKQPDAVSTGSFYKRESPIPYDWVALIDPSTNAPVEGEIQRVKRDPSIKGRDRVVVGTNAIIPVPEELKITSSKIRTANMQTDTDAADVMEVTYKRPEKLTAILSVKKDADGNALRDEIGRQILEEEDDIELRVARMRF